MSTIFLAGGSGFLGASVIRQLLVRGDTVHALRRGGRARAAVSETHPRLRWIDWDGELDALTQALVDARPDAVVSLVAHFVSEHAAADIPALIDGNLRFPTLLFDATRAAGVTSVVSAGTFWEEWSAERPIAVNLYAAMKNASKELLKYYVDAHGWAALHLRFSDLYGPSDPRRKLFHLLRSAARSGRVLDMSPGEQLIDLVHVEDGARAVLRAIELVSPVSAPPPSFPSFLEHGAFSGAPVSLRDLVAIYGSVTGVSVPVHWGGRPYRSREVMRPRTIANLPGWSASTDLESGIRDMESAPGGLLCP